MFKVISNYRKQIKHFIGKNRYDVCGFDRMSSGDHAHLFADWQHVKRQNQIEIIHQIVIQCSSKQSKLLILSFQTKRIAMNLTYDRLNLEKKWSDIAHFHRKFIT